jgi:hypothetical protein
MRVQDAQPAYKKAASKSLAAAGAKATIIDSFLRHGSSRALIQSVRGVRLAHKKADQEVRPT